jgi:hypothetical protein
MSASAVAGWIGLIWYLTVLVVCALGYFQMYVWITSDRTLYSVVECELWLTRILEPPDGDTFCDSRAAPGWPPPLTLLMSLLFDQ